MIYVFILGFWMLLNFVAQVINDIYHSFREGKNAYIPILVQAVKYTTWFWLIYKISQEF